MSGAEARALRRATLLLLLLSVVRWLGPNLPGDGAPPGETAARELLEASASELDEARLRGRELAPGERLDPNRATAAELDRLPGVGRATADAIVAMRESDGPFSATQDLLRVPGVGRVTLARLEPYLELGAAPTALRSPGPSRRVVDVNRAGPEELVSLPGIGPALAQRIVEARAAKPFARLDDLLRVRGIGPATLERLRPLVRIGGLR